MFMTEKRHFLNLFGEGNIEELVNRFFDYDINVNYLNQVLNKLIFRAEENSDDLQETNFSKFDILLDKMIEKKYKGEKNTFVFANIHALDYKLKQIFKDKKEGVSDRLSNFRRLIACFMKLGSDEIGKFENGVEVELRRLYKIYCEKGTLDHEDTKDFYNYVLNENYNSYKQSEKKDLKENIKKSLSLTEKKESLIITGKKLKKMNNLLANHDPSIDKEALLKEAILIRESIQHMIKKKKSTKKITQLEFETLESLLLNGLIEFEIVCIVLDIDDKRIAKQIVKKYEKVKMKQLHKVNLNILEQKITISEKTRLGFNHNNFKVIDIKRYKENVFALCSLFTNDSLYEIISCNMNNEESLKTEDDLNELCFLLNFANLIDGFGVHELFNILCNYKQIKKGAKKAKQIGLEARNLLANIDLVIELAEVYASHSDIITAILGENVVNCVQKQNSKRYCDFYKKVLDKKTCHIPSVSGVYGELEYESGDYHNPERLVLGLNVSFDSCLCLVNRHGEAGGKEAYIECLSRKTGSAIILSYGKEKEFIGRMLIFRRGNTVVLSDFRSKHDNYIKNSELIDEIASQILKQARENKDNIEYVLYSPGFSRLRLENYMKIHVSDVEKTFPHADLSETHKGF